MKQRSIRSITLLALFSTSAFVMPVMAADLAEPEPVIEAPIVESNSGFYLRGDLAYNFTRSEDAKVLVGGLETDAAAFNLDDAASFSAGVGYRFNDHFRVDGTASYLFQSGVDASFPCDGTNVGVPGVRAGSLGCGVDNLTADDVDVETLLLMANAYADLGNYGGITPYLGAGVGAAHVTYGNYTSDANAVAADLTTTSFDRGGGDDWRFAWALHAGTSYDISDRLKLDIGYSYNRIEEGNVAGGNISGNDTSTIEDKGFDSHMIRAGLRYRFN